MMNIEGGDDSFIMAQPGGVQRYRVLVAGNTYQECKYPEQANDCNILGVSLQQQTLEGKPIALRRWGLTRCECAAPIQAGDTVVIADAEGRIKPAAKATCTLGLPGNNNQINIQFRSPGLAGNLFQVRVIEGEENTPTFVEFSGNELNIYLELNPVTFDSVINANQLIQIINNTPFVTKLVHASNNASSNGTGLPILQTTKMQGGEGGINLVGTAQQTATLAGDIIEIFITPIINL